MESKTESKAYQEAVESIAKTIFEQRYPDGYYDYGQYHSDGRCFQWNELRQNKYDATVQDCLKDARKLLALKSPCQTCGGLGVFTSVGCTSCTKLKTCPDCNGTGKSEVPLLVVTDPNQEPPKRHDMKSALFAEGYAAAIDDIIESGSWVKVLKKKK